MTNSHIDSKENWFTSKRIPILLASALIVSFGATKVQADAALSLPIEQSKEKSTQGVSADGNAQCADVIKECFLMAAEKKNQCYFTRGQHPFCAGTTLGTIALTRWNYAKDDVGSEVLALTGEQSVDAECLEQFDKKWAAALLSGTSTDITFKKLLNQLKACERSAETLGTIESVQ
jgi:hypothetical protein